MANLIKIFLTGLSMFAQIQALEPKAGVAASISSAATAATTAASPISIAPVKIPLVIYEVNFDGLHRHIKALVHNSNKGQVTVIKANANANKIACTAAIHISIHIAKKDFVLKLGKPNLFYFEGLPDGSIEHIHHAEVYTDFTSHDLATITKPCTHAPLIFMAEPSIEKSVKDEKS